MSDTQNILTLLNQAAGFAKRENYTEAAARARVALREAEAAAAAASDDDAATAKRLVAHVETEIARYDAAYKVWNDAIAAGRQARTDAAAEEMAAPLPIPLDAK